MPSEDKNAGEEGSAEPEDTFEALRASIRAHNNLVDRELDYYRALPLAGSSRFPIVVRFALQIAGGVLAFVVIAGAAALLSYLIHLLGPLGVPSIVMIGLQAMEMLLFSVDILCMTIFVVVEAITFIRAMFDVLRGDG